MTRPRRRLNTPEPAPGAGLSSLGIRPRLIEPEVWRAMLAVRPGLYHHQGLVVRVRQVYRAWAEHAGWLWYLGGHVWAVDPGETRPPGRDGALRYDLQSFARGARRVVGRG